MTELLEYLYEVLQDVECELGEPEVAELITPALDRKIERAIKLLQEELDIE